MIRRHGGQRSVFEAAAGPVEDLLDEPLRRLDALLEDETLVDAVLQRQAQRWPQILAACRTPRRCCACRR